MTLSANRVLSSVQRIHWKSADTNSERDEQTASGSSSQTSDPYTVKLIPMQIRTYLIDVEYILQD
jgi:hypothetical protein